MALEMSSEPMQREIRLFRRQYLQLLDTQTLTWPSPETLRSSHAQEWIYENLFQTDVSHFLPPERYRLRILKLLMSKVEQSIVDPDEDVRPRSINKRNYHPFLFCPFYAFFLSLSLSFFLCLVLF
jgi:hypothetical protein